MGHIRPYGLSPGKIFWFTDVQRQAWTNSLLHLPKPQSKHTRSFTPSARTVCLDWGFGKCKRELVQACICTSVNQKIFPVSPSVPHFLGPPSLQLSTADLRCVPTLGFHQCELWVLHEDTNRRPRENTPRIHYKSHYIPIWRFPEMGVPPNNLIVSWIFHYKPSILGYPHLWNPSYMPITFNDITHSVTGWNVISWFITPVNCTYIYHHQP